MAISKINNVEFSTVNDILPVQPVAQVASKFSYEQALQNAGLRFAETPMNPQAKIGYIA